MRSDFKSVILFVPLMLLSVAIHEAGHAAMATLLGIPVLGYGFNTADFSAYVLFATEYIHTATFPLILVSGFASQLVFCVALLVALRHSRLLPIFLTGPILTFIGSGSDFTQMGFAAPIVFDYTMGVIIVALSSVAAFTLSQRRSAVPVILPARGNAVDLPTK